MQYSVNNIQDNLVSQRCFKPLRILSGRIDGDNDISSYFPLLPLPLSFKSQDIRRIISV